MSEYANMVTITCVATLLFLGGWHPLFPAPLSNFVPVMVFLLAAGICFFHGLQPARKIDRYSFPLFGLAFLLIAIIFCIPILQPILVPIFWFVEQGRRAAFSCISGYAERCLVSVMTS